MHLFTRVSLSVKMNMFGYDDDDLNNALMGLAQNPSVMVQVNWVSIRPARCVGCCGSRRRSVSAIERWASVRRPCKEPLAGG
jgi:hypothetical protein